MGVKGMVRVFTAEGSLSPRQGGNRKALELDPDLAEAHTTLAFIKLYYEWDWAAADREFLRAIELNPNYANAHHWYGEYLSLVGRHDPAIREAERARELDPLSSIINTWVGSRYFFARRYDTAVEQYRNVAELDPGFVPAHLALGQAYVQKKMFPEAIRELEKAVDLSGGSPVYLASLAHAYGVTGRKRDTSRVIDQLRIWPAGGTSHRTTWLSPGWDWATTTALLRRSKVVRGPVAPVVVSLRGTQV